MERYESDNSPSEFENQPDDEGTEAAELATKGLARTINKNKREILAEKSPTESAYYSIFEEFPKHDIDPEDFDELIEQMLSVPLRELDVFTRHNGLGYVNMKNGGTPTHYGDYEFVPSAEKESYAEIAQIYGLSSGRVSQIGQRALIRLRHASRATRIKELYASRSDLREANRDLKSEVRGLNHEVENLKAEIARLTRDLEHERGEKTAEAEAYYYLTIEELNFSTKTYNCLKRAGINTVGGIMDSGRNRVQKIRNLGKGGLSEIDAKLAELELKLVYND